MKTKTIMAVSAALALSACISSLLWTSTIPEAIPEPVIDPETGEVIPVKFNNVALAIASDASGNSYQLFPVIDQLHIRKLDPKGLVLWQQSVDDSLTRSIDDPELRVTPSGPAVAYQNNSSNQAFLKQYDLDGGLLWISDFGNNASERLQDMVAGPDGSLTVALKIASLALPATIKAHAMRFDATGGSQNIEVANCGSLCFAAVAGDTSGNTLVNLTRYTTTESYLFDASGVMSWNKTRSTNTNLALGIVATSITATATGFASLHPLVAWENDSATGDQTWSQPRTTSLGGNANLAVDAAGNLYVPNGSKISKLAADGTLVAEILLDGQNGVRQIEWREDLQRLIVLSTYETIGPEIDLTITNESGTTLLVFDAAGVKKAGIKSKPTLIKSTVCTPYPACTTITITPGQVWSNFSTTPDRKILVSGLVNNTEWFAKAYRLP